MRLQLHTPVGEMDLLLKITGEFTPPGMPKNVFWPRLFLKSFNSVVASTISPILHSDSGLGLEESLTLQTSILLFSRIARLHKALI